MGPQGAERVQFSSQTGPERSAAALVGDREGMVSFGKRGLARGQRAECASAADRQGGNRAAPMVDHEFVGSVVSACARAKRLLTRVAARAPEVTARIRSEEHTSELQSLRHLV